MRILLLTLFILSGCATSQHPFSLSADIEAGPENLKWSTFGPFTKEEARVFMDDRRESIEELLRPKIDPYKGEDSTPDMCKQKNLPDVLKKNGRGWFVEELSFYSSAHMVLGVCDNPATLLKTKYQMLYCEENKEVYVIQFFYKNDLPWNTKLEVKCR